MKTFLLPAVMAFTPLIALPVLAGDISKDTFAVGGQSNFAVDTITVNPGDEDEFEISTTSVNLAGRYYLDTNVAAALEFTRVRTRIQEDGIKEGSTDWSITPGLAFNQSINDRTQLQLSLGWQVSGITSGGSADGSGLRMGIQLQHFIADNVTFDIGLTHSRYRLENENSDISVDFSGNRFATGLTVYFPDSL